MTHDAAETVLGGVQNLPL